MGVKYAKIKTEILTTYTDTNIITVRFLYDNVCPSLLVCLHAQVSAASRRCLPDVCSPPPPQTKSLRMIASPQHKKLFRITSTRSPMCIWILLKYVELAQSCAGTSLGGVVSNSMTQLCNIWFEEFLMVS